MGMGYSACYADVIDEEEVKKLVPMEYSTFIISLQNVGIDIAEFAQNYLYRPEIEAEADDAFEALQEAFSLITGGLFLGINYHDCDGQGDRYDGVDGVFFYISDGMYQLTEAGKRFKNIISRKYYVVLG